MTMKTKLLICLAALLGVAALERATSEIKMPRARFNVLVLDEAGAPMPDATVQVIFMDPMTRQDAPQQGTTGADGLFAAEGYTEGTFGAGVTKPGFYRSGWGGPKFMGVEKGRWQPWDETYTTHLRPVINPVPFYARTGWIDVPAVGKPCGYDLEKGDWVKPHGKGTSSDLLFTVTRRYQSRKDFDVLTTITFPNKLDGIQEVNMPSVGRYSVFKWPRQAPESGYASQLETWFKSDPSSGYSQSATEEQMYFFRVKTVEQNGRIVSALYGKIKGGLRLAPSDSSTCKVELTYYLNPTSLDRNMEWDTQRNLLTGVSRTETPQDP